MREGPFHLNRGTVGRHLLLAPEAIDRVLATPGIEPVVGDRDALGSVLQHVYENLLHASFGTRPTPTQVRKARKVYSDLVGHLQSLRSLDHPPPFPPTDWRQALERWLQLEEEHAATREKGGRPRTGWDRYAYPQMLEFFTLAFGREPAATMNGPTIRFIRQFLLEGRQALGKATFDSGEEAQRIRNLWREQTDEALQQKIRAAREAESTRTAELTEALRAAQVSGDTEVALKIGPRRAFLRHKYKISARGKNTAE